MPRSFYRASLIFFSLLTISVSAQDTGAIRGTVSDSTGRRIVDASIALVDSAQDFTYFVTSDAEGKFVFTADQDGFWSAEARSPDYVARVMIRVGDKTESPNWLSPVLVVGFLVVMLAIAIWYRLLRARTQGRRP